jgi:GNAT superfamily N-acetyltransferase
MLTLRYNILRKPLNLEFTAQELLKDKDDTLIAYFDSEEIVGCVILKKLSNSSCKFRQMAVAATHQNKGIGKKIIEFAESIAGEQAISCIELNARETAVEFYQKLSYKIVGEAFDEVGLKHYRMEKVIFHHSK